MSYTEEIKTNDKFLKTTLNNKTNLIVTKIFIKEIKL